MNQKVNVVDTLYGPKTTIVIVFISCCFEIWSHACFDKKTSLCVSL